MTTTLSPTSVTIRIPRDLQAESVISNLSLVHGLRVNITAAQLSEHGKEDGWFKLQLWGSTSNIQQALIDLDDQQIEIWQDTHAQQEDW